MNAPLDDEALDEHLTRGSEVSRRYRELESDTVPAELDRRVLAAARAAAAKNEPARRAWMRWSAPVALAASAVLVLSIVLDSGVDQEKMVRSTQPAGDARPAKEEAPASQAAAAPAEPAVEVFTGLVPDATFEPQAPQAAPSAPPPAPARRVRQDAEDRRFAGRPGIARPPTELADASVERFATAPVAVRAEVPPVENDSSAIEEAVATGQRRISGPRDTIARSSANGADASGEEAELERELQGNRTDPERWLEEIRQLRRDRKVREADAEWERFRAAFPQYPVAAHDIAAQRR